MRALRVLEQLPADYVVVRGERGVLAIRRELAERFRQARLGPEGEWPLQASDLAGRQPLYELALGAEQFLVRRFRHGGLLRWFTGSRFADPERPFREIALSQALRQRGFATPEIAAARARAATGGGYGLELVTRRVAGAVDLGLWLASSEGREDATARRRVLVAAGRLVRALHDQGFLHADLQPRNLLVERASLRAGDVSLWLLDLDRSLQRAHLTEDERRLNLRRLYRHIVRLEREGALRLSASDQARFLLAYEDQRDPRRALARAIGRDHERSLALHALGWAIERAFGRRRSRAVGSAGGGAAP